MPHQSRCAPVPVAVSGTLSHALSASAEGLRRSSAREAAAAHGAVTQSGKLQFENSIGEGASREVDWNRGHTAIEQARSATRVGEASSSRLGTTTPEEVAARG